MKMVFFNCNGCGEAMKKNQVEKHTYRCRQCHSLSCVDCGKDFVGNDYQKHTKCMTEEEKYCGKGYVPKVNKGEAKQEQWIEKVQEAITKSKSKPSLKKLLERLMDYPNIPRKKAKFENFLKNSLRIQSTSLISEVWDVLMTATPEPSGNQESTQSQPGPISSAEESQNTNGVHDAAESQQEENTKKLNKRERKLERQKRNKKKKDPINSEEEEGKMKKSKKRKHEMDRADTGEMAQEEEAVPKKRKKEKYIDQGQNGLTQDQEEKENNQEEAKEKFKLVATILEVVRKKEEISVKKLRKKVLNRFYELEPAGMTEEKMLKKFDKKLVSIGEITVFKDRVMLKSLMKTKYA